MRGAKTVRELTDSELEAEVQWWLATLGVRGPSRCLTATWVGRVAYNMRSVDSKAATAIAAEVVEATHPDNRANGLKPGDVLFTRTVTRSELAFRGPDALAKFVRFALSADELPA